MAKPYLIDTDVLIDFNRMHADAVDFIMSLARRPAVSAVTVTELYAGVREGRERNELDAFISRCAVIPVEAQIAERGGLIFREYFKSHGTGFADAIIAATVEIERLTLVTLNARHFPMCSDVVVPYTKA